MKLIEGSVSKFMRVPFSLGALFCLLAIAIFSSSVDAQRSPGKQIDVQRAEARSKAGSAFHQARLEADERAGSGFQNFSMPAPQAPLANPVIFAYNQEFDKLISFNAATPEVLLTEVDLVGLDLNNFEILEFIDFRPADGLLYAVATKQGFPNAISRLVTINVTTGVVTTVGTGIATLSNDALFYGGDFNPMVDRLREVSDNDFNRRINPNDGTIAGVDTNLAYAAGDPNAAANPNVVHVAYTNNFAGATQTTLYGIDSGTDSLVTIGNLSGTISPNTGQVFTVGSLGVNVANFGGFDIQQGTGLAFAAFRISGVSYLYSVNLATGQATLIGQIGFGDIIDGIAILPGGASADLTITKTDAATEYTPGQQAVYTVTVTNAGPDPVVGATVTDNFSALFTSGSFTCVGANGGTCVASGAGNISTPVNLPAGGTVTFTITGNISPNATGDLVNTATVTSPIGVDDPIPGNNTATDINTLRVVTADLSITKTDNSATYVAGQQSVYTVVVSNAGPDAVVGATVTDTFSAAFSGASFTCVGAGGGTCPASGTGNIAAPVNLPSGGSATFTINATVSPNTTGTLTNTATVTVPGGVTDPNPANNTAVDTSTQLVVTADLSITKTDNSPTYIPGQQRVYTVVVSNAGPDAVVGATVTDTFSALFTGASFTCIGSNGGACPASGTGNMSVPVNLPSGSFVTFTINATVSPNATGPLTNTATVTVPAGVVDPVPGNNTATDTNNQQATNADLSITKDNGTNFYVPGQPSVYTVVVSNAGPDPAFGAVVTDTMSNLFTSSIFTCTGINGATCPNTGLGNISAPVNLPAGSSVTFIITGNVSPNATGPLVNTATVTVPAGMTDPNPANNSATDTDNLRPTAAGVTVSGRVLSPDGRGVRGARVTITDSQGVSRNILTSSLGFYSFDDVTAGETYVLAVGSRQYRFSSRVVQVNDSLSDIDFIGQE